MALVALSVIEQRYRAVMAVLDGASVSEVAAEVGRVAPVGACVGGGAIARRAWPGWRIGRIGRGRVRIGRRRSWRRVVCELRRAHPKWGALRILHELMRGPAPPERLPSRSTVQPDPACATGWWSRARGGASARTMCAGSGRRRCSSGSWTSSIGPRLVDTATGELREARIVTGVDDHSRYCVLARVVERATGRAICLAFTEALERYGAPEEVLTDNGKQFTDRFGRGGEVLFDKICRRNGIAHRLTAPSSPTTTGKIERFHQTLRRELLDDARPFTSLLEAQAALDDWVREYNAERPHQALETAGAGHAGRALPAGAGRAARAAAALAARAALAAVPEPQRHADASSARSTPAPHRRRVEGGPVEFDRVVPPSGNLWAMRRQFWLGPQRAGQTVRFWAGVDVIHLTIDGARVKSLRSHLSVADLAQLARDGALPAGPAAAAAGRGRSGDRGRPRGQQQRPRRPGRHARCSPPRSSAAGR